VVLEHVDGGDLPELGEVERLVEGADVRRPVAEEGDRDARLAAQLERERRTRDRGQPAADDRVRAQVPALEVVEVHRAAVAVRAALDLPVELRHHLVRVRAPCERVAVRAMRRGEDVARDRLLADRDVEEARQLARAEALLDLLLEVADQQHLLQELPQPLPGERSPLALDLGHEPESMLRAVSPARQWQQIQAGLPEDWSDARLSLRLGDENAARRAAALLTPLQPTRSGLELRFYVARRGAGAAPSALERGLARLDEERIGAELELLAAAEGVTATTVTTAGTRKTLVEEWDEALADLPGDWSDLYAEIELTS